MYNRSTNRFSALVNVLCVLRDTLLHECCPVLGQCRYNGSFLHSRHVVFNVQHTARLFRGSERVVEDVEVPLCAHLDTEALQGNTVDAFTRGGAR